MSNYTVTTVELTSIADAIRSKGGTSASLMYPTGFVSAINAIETQGTYQSKSTSPSEEQIIVTPDTGYDALSQVTISAISSNYVGSNIISRSSSDLSASGSVITVPSGYYAAEVTKAINSGSATTPATTITVTPGITISAVGIITATVNSSKSIVPTVSAGYVSSGTAGTITASGSNTYELTTTGTAIITPNETVQNAVLAGTYAIGNVVVAAISSNYIGSNVTQNSAANITVAGPTVSIPSGYYSADVSKTIASGAIGVSNAFAEPGIGTITLDSANGVINISRASNTYDITAQGASEGYIDLTTVDTGIFTFASASASYQLSTQSAVTYTPSTATQTIPSGIFLTGVQTVEGDSNLIAANIAAGVSIFGIEGTHTGGTDTSDATLSSGDQMLSGYTAYASGVKYTGTITTQSASGNTTLNASTTSKSFAAGYYPNAHGCVVTVYDGSVS